MAVQAVEAWWIWQVGSVEVGAYETELEATTAAESMAWVNAPAMLLKGTLYKLVEEEEE